MVVTRTSWSGWEWPSTCPRRPLPGPTTEGSSARTSKRACTTWPSTWRGKMANTSTFVQSSSGVERSVAAAVAVPVARSANAATQKARTAATRQREVKRGVIASRRTPAGARSLSRARRLSDSTRSDWCARPDELRVARRSFGRRARARVPGAPAGCFVDIGAGCFVVGDMSNSRCTSAARSRKEEPMKIAKIAIGWAEKSAFDTRAPIERPSVKFTMDTRPSEVCWAGRLDDSAHLYKPLESPDPTLASAARHSSWRLESRFSTEASREALSERLETRDARGPALGPRGETRGRGTPWRTRTSRTSLRCKRRWWRSSRRR